MSFILFQQNLLGFAIVHHQLVFVISLEFSVIHGTLLLCCFGDNAPLQFKLGDILFFAQTFIIFGYSDDIVLNLLNKYFELNVFGVQLG